MANLTHVLKQKQVFSTSDLTRFLGGKSKIRLLVESQRIVPVGRGYYATHDLEHWQALTLILARYFPSAILSGEIALKIHGLQDSLVTEIQADIDRSTNQKNSLFKFRRVSKSRQTGAVEMNFNGARIRIYEPERCLADLGHQKGTRAALKSALGNYLRQGRIRINKLRFYDQMLKTNLARQIEQMQIKKSYLRPSGGTPRLSTRDHILRSAIVRYAQYGNAGLDLKALAKDTGLSLSALAYHFPSNRALSKGVLDSFETHFANSGLAEIFINETPPIEFATRYAQGLMDMADNDEIAYRVQMWSIAEQNPHVRQLMEKLCTPLVLKMTEKIQRQVKGISAEEAEMRAVMFGSTLDQYATMRWYYSHIISGKLTRNELITGYRKMLLDQLLEICFAPPKRNFILG